MQLDRHEQWTNHGRFESIADSEYQQQARQNSGWMHYGHHSCTRASGTLTIEKDWSQGGHARHFATWTPPVLFCQLNDRRFYSWVFKLWSTKNTRDTQRARAWKIFKDFFLNFFIHRNYFKGQKPTGKLNFISSLWVLNPDLRGYTQNLVKKNYIEQHTGLLRWSTSNPNPLNLQPHSKDEEDKWWIRTDWSPNHTKYEVTLRRTRRTGRLTVMANFVSFCWPTLAVGLCWILKILRRGPLLDIVTREDVNKGGMCWYEPVTICIDLHKLLARSGCPLFDNRALCDDEKKCAIWDLSRG